MTQSEMGAGGLGAALLTVGKGIEARTSRPGGSCPIWAGCGDGGGGALW